MKEVPLPTDLRRFVLTDDDLLTIAAASKPRLLSLEDQRSPQMMANRAWKRVGDRLGFDWNTVQPDPTTKDRGTILAVPLKGANDE